jgi:Type VI secretion system/phage-baseplate injector OB domain
MSVDGDTDYVYDLAGSDDDNSRSAGTFYGKYRGTVLNNIDPLFMGRIQAFVPDVAAVLPTTWAMPCVPIAGIQSGAYVVPAIGSGVWIEFEQGDADYPIWVGGFWGSAADVPALAQAGIPGSPSIVLQTQTQNTLMISDAPGPVGGILLKTRAGASIAVNDAGIQIQNGQGASLVLAGPSVMVNMSALVVT